MGGAIGNMIDRIRFKYVTDFIYFKIINFPVFNVADIFVTVSVFVLIFLFILKYKSALCQNTPYRNLKITPNNVFTDYFLTSRLSAYRLA